VAEIRRTKGGRYIFQERGIKGAEELKVPEGLNIDQSSDVVKL
jgi:hypothetical protein